ncbi:MAG TPA: ATP phosphoribosyltransferase regulatory subunit [Dehalococcoidales bacterium]|nr:ATP phosphoribosyltransferase regulatory subunit [Dehalococcoidales bacterium]
MRDLSPAEMTVFRLVEGICRDICSRWGYQEVRTPTIEYLHLFTSAGTLTPGMLGKVYSFLDWDGWSGERVVLRPDGTIPVARLYTEGLQGRLARLFYAANIFIFEEAGEKTRERWQCGAELIGAGSAMADAELIALSLEVLKKLGLKGVELRLSHAGLIKALLVKLGLSPDEQNRMFDRILDGDAEALAEVSRESPEVGDTLRPFLSLKGQSPGFLRNQRALLARSLPEVRPHLDDFLQTVALLDDLGVKYQINIASGAGFEYYTGIIFQLFIGKEKVGGGGRYDALIPSMGGGDVPASGFALYLDRLMNLVKPEVFVKTVPERVLVRVKSGGAVKEAFKAADSLRQAGYIAELDLDGKKTDLKWIIEVGSEAPVFTMVDAVAKKKIEASTINEVLKRLEGKGADKDSPA